MGLVASVCQPSILRMVIWPEASNAQNNMAAVSADGSTVCVLIRRLNSACNLSMALVVRTLRHLLSQQSREGQEPIAGFLQAVRDGSVLEPPLADEGFAARFDLFACCRVDHVVVVGGDLLVQALRCVGKQVAVLVDGAALDRHVVPHGGNRALKPRAAINDEEFRPPQAALDEIIEHGAPGLGALAAHLLDRQENFLAVGAHAEHDEQRDRGYSACKIDPLSRGIGVQN